MVVVARRRPLSWPSPLQFVRATLLNIVITFDAALGPRLLSMLMAAERRPSIISSDSLVAHVHFNLSFNPMRLFGAQHICLCCFLHGIMSSFCNSAVRRVG